jgi:uncharacterized protein with HEPN domain
MSRRDPLLRVRHMRDHAREAVELLASKSLDEVLDDRTLQLALTRLLEVIGEAASRVNDAFRQAHADVPWAKAAGMRNKLIHDYEYVDLEIVYKTVRNELPALLAQLDAILD